MAAQLRQAFQRRAIGLADDDLQYMEVDIVRRQNPRQQFKRDGAVAVVGMRWIARPDDADPHASPRPQPFVPYGDALRFRVQIRHRRRDAG